jgi:uncharacterized membrane protein
MKQRLLKLLLLGLLCAAGPGYAGAETLPQRSGFAALTATAKHPPKQANGPTEFEQSVSRFAIAMFVLGTIALIAGLVEGSNVLIPVLVVGVSVLCLFIMSRIAAAREKKAKKKPPTAPAKK